MPTALRVHNPNRGTWTYGPSVDLVVVSCPECGIVHAIPKDFRDAIAAAGRPSHYYCPNGHDLGWSESEADRQRKRAEQLQRRLSSQEDTARRWQANAEAERRSAIAYKGHLTRMRRRISNGVCPVPGCKRSGFERVMAHIASQHPDWLHEHQDDLDG